MIVKTAYKLFLGYNKIVIVSSGGVDRIIFVNHLNTFLDNTMKKKLKNKLNDIRRNRAFTLIEILVVVAIIALLSSVVLNSLAEARMKANDTKIAEDLRQVRKAIEIYYNDNNSFPDPTILSSGNQKNDDILSSKFSNGLSNKLVFFAKTASAQGSVTHSTPLCANFDNVTNMLVAGKYLSDRPVHPYDNDESGICYKATKTLTSFVAYSVLSSRVNTSGGAVNKRFGFIVGDESQAGFESVNDAIVETFKKNGTSKERGYPAGADGNSSPYSGTNGSLVSIDAIDGISSGSSVSSGGISGIIKTATEYFSSSPTNLPLYAKCSSDSQCASGRCIFSRCGNQPKLETGDGDAYK